MAEEALGFGDEELGFGAEEELGFGDGAGDEGGGDELGFGTSFEEALVAEAGSFDSFASNNCQKGADPK